MLTNDDAVAPLAFPDGFVWGAATSAYQIEGGSDALGRTPSVWDVFGDRPGAIADGDTGAVACDHVHRMTDDVALMAELGLQAYRFSISWPRVLPNGTGEVSAPGLGFYDRLVDQLLEAGIEPHVTLFHWDLPQALEERGGWRNRDCADWFADYAGSVARTLGDRVASWATLNEPWCYAFLGHASGIHAPGMVDDAAAVAVAHHQLLGHGRAVAAMRALLPAAALGVVINPAPVAAAAGETVDDDVIRRVDGIRNRWWLDPVLTGRYPADVLDDFGPWAGCVRDGDAAEIGAPIDWLGVNYYNDELIRRPGAGEDVPRSPYPGVPTYAPADPAGDVDGSRLADHARRTHPLPPASARRVPRPAADLHHRERRRVRRPDRRRAAVTTGGESSTTMPICARCTTRSPTASTSAATSCGRCSTTSSGRGGTASDSVWCTSTTRRSAARSATVGGGTRRSPAPTRS